MPNHGPKLSGGGTRVNCFLATFIAFVWWPFPDFSLLHLQSRGRVIDGLGVSLVKSPHCGLKAKNHRRSLSFNWLHALAAVVVERSIRKCSAGPGIRLDCECVLQTRIQPGTGDWLLAHESFGICFDAQRRAKGTVGCGKTIFSP